MSVSIKLRHGEDCIRRFSCPSDTSYDQFVNVYVLPLLGFSNPTVTSNSISEEKYKDISMTYLDDEGDSITCSSQREWQEALSIHKKMLAVHGAKKPLDITVHKILESTFPKYKQRLESPLANIRSDYHVIVVGSGYGGGIAASRIARAGQQVCLLERGKEKWPGQFPESLVEVAENVQYDSGSMHVGKKTALFDFRRNKEMWVMIGCGLGGTSLINASVSLPPDPRIYDQFPKQILQDWQLMEQCFSISRDWLQPTFLPDSITLAKTQGFKRQSSEVDGKWYKAPINVAFEAKVSKGGIQQNPCNLCGNCVTGCNIGAKTTTLMNYIPDAYNWGCEVYCEVQVEYVERLEAQKKWKLHCVKYSDHADPVPFTVTCDICVLAGGSLGSTEIMLRSKQNGLNTSAMVGKKFTSNGDCLGFAYNGNMEMNAMGYAKNDPNLPKTPVGPTITSCCDMRATGKPLEDCFMVEEGAVPISMGFIAPEALAAASAVIGQRTGGDYLQQKYRELQSLAHGCHYGADRNTQTFLFVGHDKANGHMYLENNKLRIEWPEKDGVFQKSLKVMLDLSKKDQSIFVRDPLYSKLGGWNLITVHPLGGCAMAENGTTGVINHKGQVFTGSSDQVYDSLYVCDGSIFPAAIGVNPLLTICALAERIIVWMARDHGWKINMEDKKPARVVSKEIDF